MTSNDAAPKPSVFQEDAPRVPSQEVREADALLLNIDGFEGPIDVLLELARHQKVDLVHVSILQLVRQYMAFIERAQALDLELAAEYLVMAAWLAYLKSRLLLPREDESVDPSAEEMAEALQFQLRRLEAMQQMADRLMEQPQLGSGVFARGAPEGLNLSKRTRWNVQIYDILKAYGDIRKRAEEVNYDLPVFHLMSMDNAMARMSKMLGALPRKGLNSVWTTLTSFVPEGIKDRLYARSALASSFTAGLELAKQGKIEIKQDGLFRPVYMRALADNDPQATPEKMEKVS
ncbi:MAG: segregation/condensation protein A [Micavibrio sp.]|nr:segregation/condensation protein A [Micavibrio sp.]|tara:strand:- start:414 stop:1283 length:870 start_codon:yes stop_codon:yes gene_type:complete